MSDRPPMSGVSSVSGVSGMSGMSGVFGRPVLLRARDLACAYGGSPLFAGLSFDLSPGLTLVCGGEGRGKSTLLRLISGDATPTAGRVERLAPTVFHADAHDPRDDRLSARGWLLAWRERCPGWDPAIEAALVDGFALSAQLDKGLFMLSTGTRRKVWLTAGFASGAALTMLDMPWAALDGPARDLLTACLAEAATQARRAWVVADYALPAALSEVARAGTIDLGD